MMLKTFVCATAAALLAVPALGDAIARDRESIAAIAKQGRAHVQSEQNSLLNTYAEIKPQIGMDPAVPLLPRTPYGKRDRLVLPDNDPTPQLMVKFRDDCRVRLNRDGTVRSETRADLNEAIEAVTTRGGVYVPVFTNPPDVLERVRERAAAFSGVEQPDLQGMMFVAAPINQLEAIGNDLLKMDCTEFVMFKRDPMLYQDESCNDGTADCVDPAGAMTPFCSDPGCCVAVGDVRPSCVDELFGQWDATCAAIANLICNVQGSPGADRCISFLAGPCFETHPTRGCNDETCCTAVCAIRPFCCGGDSGFDGVWDDDCVQIALSLNDCVSNDVGTPPNLTDHQGYLRSIRYDEQVGGIPAGVIPQVALGVDGYNGVGYNLDNPADPFGGLYGLGEELFSVNGVGDRNRSRGFGIKVAVIEGAAYNNHVDLDVTVEPGQTMLYIEDVTEPGHATACLGIIGARDDNAQGSDDEVGTIGIAPECELHFFPYFSVEEGNREDAAWISAIDELGAGDVISCSYGKGVNLTMTADTHLLITLATNSGITVCCSAGNDCANLEEQNADPGTEADTNAIIVGACTPGEPFCRLGFSNHYESDTIRTVHVSAWGEGVTTTGGRPDLFNVPGNPNLGYTSSFNGTSSACPIVAGLVACLQGLSVQFYGAPLRPEQIRGVMSRNSLEENFIQCFSQQPPGAPDGAECFGDFDQDEEPNRIGPFPRARRAGIAVISNFFDAARTTTGLQVLRGFYQLGNAYYIEVSDDLRFIVRSQFTPRQRVGRRRPTGQNSFGYGQGTTNEDESLTARPVLQANYMAAGQIADVLVTARTDEENPNVIRVDTEVQYPGQFSLLFVEIWDWTLNRWVLTDLAQIAESQQTDGDVTNESLRVGASGMVHPDGGLILVRLWMLGLGSGGTNSPFDFELDLVNVLVGSNVSDPVFGENDT
jgi:hypothetical protein